MDNFFKNRLDRLRKEVSESDEKMSIENFAHKCHVSASAIRKYRTGERKPNLDNIIKIANECNVSVGWLATGEGDMSLDTLAQGAKKMREELTKEMKVKATIEPGSAAKKKTIITQSEEAVATAQMDTKISTLLTMTTKVLESDTPYSPALSANIKAFSMAVANESELAKVKQNNQEIMSNMAKMETRMTELEKRLNGRQNQATG